MRIALFGYGKMGREIEAVAAQQGETIAAVFNSRRPASAGELVDVDLCIDFSTPTSAVQNICAAAQAHKDIVVGTTGWFERLDEVRPLLAESGLLYSANFSLGMNIFIRTVKHAAELMRNDPGYDPFIHEIHHREKRDAPSGTALRLADVLLENMPAKRHVLSGNPNGKIASDALHVTSTRAGSAAGTHTVGFDSDADLIELRHVAKNRRGFALGALKAARWLRGRKGVYTMDDVDF